MRGWLLDLTRGTSSFGFAMILIVGSVFLFFSFFSPPTTHFDFHSNFLTSISVLVFW